MLIAPGNVTGIVGLVNASEDHFATIGIVGVAVEPEGKYGLCNETLIEHHVEGGHYLLHCNLRESHALRDKRAETNAQVCMWV